MAEAVGRSAAAVTPSADEIRDLTERADDPILSRVAVELVRRIAGGGDDAGDAREAVNILHGLCRRQQEASR